MSILVRNELDHTYVFGRGAGASKLEPGEVGLIAPEELNSVPSMRRGVGGINPLSSDPASRNITQFDYADVNGTYEPIYIGQAAAGTADADDRWTIKKFAYVSLGGTNQVSSVLVQESVAWSDRASLDWA